MSPDKFNPTEETLRRRRGRPKKRIDPHLQAEICRRYFRDKSKAYAGIAAELSKEGFEVGDDRWFTKLINNARDEGLIFFDVDETFALQGEEREFEGNDLETSYDLQEAVVVEVPPPFESASVEPSVDPGGMRADDYVHTVLANHAGKFLARKMRTGDHWAVAGGRAVNQAVRKLRRVSPGLKNVMVTSMGGRLWSHKWWGSGPSSMRPLDPDDSAFILFMALENQEDTMFDQVGHRVFTDSRDVATEVMKEHCMFLRGGTWYEDNQPNKAIVGVGVVDPASGHRAVRNYEGSKRVKDLMNRHLNKVRHELKGAIETVSDSQLYFGDIANRYFATLPLPVKFHEHPVEYYDKIYTTLIGQLSDLNERMVVVEWEHIRSIPLVTAVAGGKFKRGALWTILFAGLDRDRKRLIDNLITDAATAADLMTQLKAYERLDASAKRWYQKIVRTLFCDPEPAE